MVSDHCQIVLPACDTRLQKYREMQLLSAAYIRNLAVIGGGQMGTGIAQVAAIAGQQVLVLILLASRYWYCRLTGIETNSRRDCFKFQASLNKCRW